MGRGAEPWSRWNDACWPAPRVHGVTDETCTRDRVSHPSELGLQKRGELIGSDGGHAAIVANEVVTVDFRQASGGDR